MGTARVPPNNDASTVVNIKKVFGVYHRNLFTFQDFSTRSFAAEWATVLHPHHARMDARTHETTLKAWAQYI
jgi:hypothetical protein